MTPQISRARNRANRANGIAVGVGSSCSVGAAITTDPADPILRFAAVQRSLWPVCHESQLKVHVRLNGILRLDQPRTRSPHGGRRGASEASSPGRIFALHCTAPRSANAWRRMS